MDSPTIKPFDHDPYWAENWSYSFLFNEDRPLLFNTGPPLTKLIDDEPLGNYTSTPSQSETPLNEHIMSTVKAEIQSQTIQTNTENLPKDASSGKNLISKQIRTSKRRLESKPEPVKNTTPTVPAKSTILPKPGKKRGRKSKLEMQAIKEAQLQNYKATKNLTKNFGTAITGFALSDLAKPYLETILIKENLSREAYLNYVNLAKKEIKSIEAFRNSILQQEGDSPEIASCKRSFQAIAVIFMKYFCVNWIIHGKINNKMTYLKYRFRILRRIEEPEIFTYVKFQDKKSKRSRRKRSK